MTPGFWYSISFPLAENCPWQLLYYTCNLKNVVYKGGPTPPPEFIYKNCVFIPTCLNFSHLQNILHLIQYTFWDFFPTAQNSF